VIRVETGLSPLELLERLQSVQRKAGRPVESMRFAPRVLDLDILLYDDLILDDPRMVDSRLVITAPEGENYYGLGEYLDEVPPAMKRYHAMADRGEVRVPGRVRADGDRGERVTDWLKGTVADLAVSAGLLLVAGCMTAGPDYEPPATTAPTRWNVSLTSDLSAAAVDPRSLSLWWAVFDDALLSDLMERARTNNLELRRAEARVREARAQRGMARADLFPAVSVRGAAARARSSTETGLGATTPDPFAEGLKTSGELELDGKKRPALERVREALDERGIPRADLTPQVSISVDPVAVPEVSVGATSDLFSNGFDASWEPDLFGGKRRALEAASATLQAQQEDLRDVLVSLFAEVALNYVDVRSCQARLALSETNLAKLAVILNKYPETNILIEGHTDDTGTEAYNMALSKDRAQSVSHYLATVEVKSARFSVAGYGETQPIVTNDSPEGRQKNRRVDIAVLANDKLKKAAQEKAKG
jgi:hypothetical protein